MADTFSLDLSRLIAKAQGQTELVVRKVMLDTFTRVVRRSPVDTGRFRANWVVGINSANTATSDATDKSGSSAISRITSEVQTAKVRDDVSVYCTNSLSYAHVLEYGRGNGKPGSLQAPNGMVRVTLTEIASRYGA